MAVRWDQKKFTPELKEKIANAQKINLHWESACSPALLRTIRVHAEAIGAPKEYILFPLLTATASFMGVNASMQINPEWQEPAILWNIVVARKGEKKTAALKRLLKIVEVSCKIINSYLLTNSPCKN